MREILPNIFAVEIPDEVADLHFYRVNNQSIMFKWKDVKRPLNVNDVIRVDYYDGDLKNYTWPILLFCLNDITEDGARAILANYGLSASIHSIIKSNSLTGSNYAIIKKS